MKMTVKELKELLNNYDENLEVKINTYISNEAYDDFGEWHELDVKEKAIRKEKKFRDNKEILLLNWEF
ncbi:MAG: hypothetical protein ACRCXT_08675 [Paraclostridium sp.]